MLLRTGRKYSRYPCEHIGLPHDPELDFVLTTALELYEDSLCPGGCGVPLDEAHAAENDGRYERRTVTCYACAANTPGKDHKPAPGELPYLWRNPKPPRRRGRRGAARPTRA